MKIGIDHAPTSLAGTYFQHLVRILTQHAPENEYVVDHKRYSEVDIYHCFRPVLPVFVRWRRIPSVMTVANLNFLRYPHLYTLSERIFLLRGYRRALRSADRLITVDDRACEELAGKLAIDRRKIEVILPLAALVPRDEPSQIQLDAVRRKYDLPQNFILMLGTVEPRHHHGTLLEALCTCDSTAGIVICGRRTTYSDSLLTLARERHMAACVDFIYELQPADLPLLFRLARAFVYLPDSGIEASIIPVVEALRAGVPMVLSDTSPNRDAAADAAMYVDPESVSEVVAALDRVLTDNAFRTQIQAREEQRAELYSEYAVAQRLVDVYSSL